jgi:hypothetical protein
MAEYRIRQVVSRQGVWDVIETTDREASSHSGGFRRTAWVAAFDSKYAAEQYIRSWMVTGPPALRDLKRSLV